MRILDWLFGWNADNRRRRDGSQEAARKLSPAMPMAGAGAELQATPGESETERAVKAAAERNDPRS